MTVVWALTWLGQSAAIAALTAAFVRLPVCRASAAARHVAWGLAFLLCAAFLAWPFVTAATTIPAPGPVAGAVGSAPLVLLPAPVVRLSPWLGWAWAVGAIAGLALVARDLWRVLRLKRRTVTLTAQEVERVGAALAARASRRQPRLVWCDELECPAVLGFLGPVIALPHSQVSVLADGQCRLVVLHELAHVRRGDDWWTLADRILLALMWINPAAHWVRRNLSLSREMACDEWVVRQTASPVAYARCLADVAGWRSRRRQLGLAAGVAGGPGTLRARILGVLALDGRRSARAAALAAWLAPMAVGVAAVGILGLPPVFDIERPPAMSVAAPAPAGPAEAGQAAVARPAVRRGATTRPNGDPGALVPRRPSVAELASAGPQEAGGASAQERLVAVEPRVPETTVAHDEIADLPPLAASPVAGAGVSGVTGPAPPAGAVPASAGAGSWWGGPAAIGGAAAGAAETAGRATASFFTRVGSRVPQLLKR